MGILAELLGKTTREWHRPSTIEGEQKGGKDRTSMPLGMPSQQNIGLLIFLQYGDTKGGASSTIAYPQSTET